ncbi:hypothetical protein IGI04_037228 [Brassica rapa subsp. trilocularis]|uniref:Calmodulin-binding domain-containing protein n=1 Tax=Brassica rapa subsp. trilocularis TaxID=1813537 RepID=A0ABQ7LGR6_BRACM|nr:hypothetical protein IGI04_037228 [Brassica rapa subsp. trilocularis]
MFRKVQLSQKKPWRKRSQNASNSKEPGGCSRIRRWTPMIIVAQPPEKKCTNRKETVSKNSLTVRRKKAVATNSVNPRTVPENKDIKSQKKPESEEVKSLKQLHKMENKENTVVAAGAGEEIQV